MRRTGTLCVLAVFTLFAFCVLTVVLFGAETLQRLEGESEANFQARTAALYLSGKLRQSPRPADISVVRFGGGDCLAIPEEADGEALVTRLYCHDGWLTELFGSAAGEYDPEEGEPILRAAGFTAERREGLLTLTVRTEAGETVTLRFALRGGTA